MEEKKIPVMNGYGLSHVEIKDAINGCAQIYLDGQLVKGVMGYKIEQDAAKNRVPLLTVERYPCCPNRGHGSMNQRFQ